MKKFLKWLIIVFVSLVVLLFIGYQIMLSQTKKHSPEQTAVFKSDDLEISVQYSQPSKKEREIFGGLVPYGEVWRTGANEPTTFSTNKAILIDGQTLSEGTYSLWTIPERESWTVIFSSGQYDWGMSWGNKASRLPEDDVLNVVVPAQQTSEEMEKFTIDFVKDPDRMRLQWDQTLVEVAIEAIPL